jgi:hypothetical protein
MNFAARYFVGLAMLVPLAGCGQGFGSVVAQRAQSEATYAVPVEDARRILATTGQPPFVFGTRPPRFALVEQSPTRLVWAVSQNGAEVMRFAADLSPAGTGTRVGLNLTGATSGRLGNVEERFAEKPSIRRLYLAAMQEQIAADLESRPFDMSAIYSEMTAATLANIGSISDQMDRAAAEYRRRDRENIEKAYREEARGRSY